MVQQEESSTATSSRQQYQTFSDEDDIYDNLPPEYGPFDEIEPILEPEAPLKIKTLVTAVGLTILVFTLLISTVAFASLYFHLVAQNSSHLPKWPPPSISPLGKYSKASVAADNEICSEIGRNILLQGGNAVDAAISALFCIGVMDTHSAGIGGGHFMTIYNATTKSCTVVDAREIAPLAATEEMYRDKWNQSRIGWKAIAVPGELHGLRTEFDNFASHKIPWHSLIAPTIQLLKEGYPTSHALAKALKQNEKWIASEKTMRQFINPATQRVFAPGEQIATRQNFLETFGPSRQLQRSDRRFLCGWNCAECSEDFKNYRSIIHSGADVITTRLSGGRAVCGPPPPSGSAVAQAILSILDGYPYTNLTTFAKIATTHHNFIEASKFAYAARSWLGDPRFVANATEIARNITSREWAEWVRKRITDRPHEDAYYGGDFRAVAEDHGTTHVSVIDADGNAVSVTSTINLYLGAMVSSESTGILWNNEMDDFSTPGHPNFFGFPPSPANFIRPAKRPMSSQSPIIIYGEDGQLVSVGGAGGSTIISGVAAVAHHTIWRQKNPKEAVDLPRLHNQFQPNYTSFEPTFPKKYIRDLQERGHQMRPVNNLTVVTVTQKAADGQIYANSDFRKGEESAPAGY
ncbi:unnamed protein product [Caenorhabditis angaria]|uniref:Gamma-glutamyltransferase n=1 Tax=Caenorhabditis angaria TaxID=860376 RepID=A0A9P1I7M6_9PELO|nr:unnamed protein product [Caenorhabditis angaria]